MSDRIAFLNHIADHPDADLPRLVFADYLDEQGDPLGEFIRVQIELSHRQNRLGDEVTQALLAREDEIWAENWGVWACNCNLRFDRGLPANLQSNWYEFDAYVGDILNRWPTIRTTSVAVDCEQGMRSVADCLHLYMVRSLHLEGWPAPVWIQEIVDSPNWNTESILRLNLNVEGPFPLLADLRYLSPIVRRLELVQPFPGPPMRRGNPRGIDDAIEALVRNLNASVGRDFAVLIRPYERLYPLLGDLGGGFFAGHLKSGAAALFHTVPQGRRVAFCTFTDEGRVDKSLWEDTTEPPWTLDRLRARFGFELGFIRVREFEANNHLAVRFWPRAARDIIADGTYEEDPEIAGHLADPLTFAVGFDRREVRVAYRTGRGTGAAG